MLFLVLVALGAAACHDETPLENAERKLRNAGDKIEDAAHELK
jgi:hypothetical protein